MWCRVFIFPPYYTAGSQILVVVMVLVLEKCNAGQAVLACVTAIIMVNKCEGCGSEICTIGSYILYAEKEHQNI